MSSGASGARVRRSGDRLGIYFLEARCAKAGIDPVRDLNEIEDMLFLTDLLQIERRLDRLEREHKKELVQSLWLLKMMQYLQVLKQHQL